MMEGDQLHLTRCRAKPTEHCRPGLSMTVSASQCAEYPAAFPSHQPGEPGGSEASEEHVHHPLVQVNVALPHIMQQRRTGEVMRHGAIARQQAQCLQVMVLVTRGGLEE